MTARPARRHARKASATTAEEILLPAELMAGLTSGLPTRPGFASSLPPLAETLPDPLSVQGELAPAPIPDLSRLDLAPLFPGADTSADTPSRKASEEGRPEGRSTSEEEEGTSQTSPNDGPSTPHSLPAQPDKGILKVSKKDEHSTSRWSLWPGAKKWFTGSMATPSSLDLSPTHPTFDLGAGIPAYRMSTDDSALLSRTAPSLDFERSTNFVPPLSQERIKSTEFWSNFALELDPSKLKRIRFSMPLIVTEFDPETSRVYDPADALIWDTPRDPAVTATSSSDLSLHGNDRYPGAGSPTTEESGENDDDDNDNCSNNCNNDSDTGGELTTSSSTRTTTTGRDSGARTSTDSRVSCTGEGDVTGDAEQTGSICAPSSPRQRPIQWNLDALTHRQYRVQEVWELYERTCRSLDIEPLPSFEKILVAHMRKEQTLGSLDLAGTRLDGAHMKCFADMLDLNFGLVKLELSYCEIDDDAVRLLVYSLLCNDSVRYLSLAHNPRLHSDGVRYVSILVRHSKQLQMLDMSGIPVRKKSAGYLAAALTGLGANWSLGRGSMHKKTTACEQISLQALRMNCCGIKPAALAILASGVRLSPLQHLSLHSNSLTGSAGPILREMLYGDPPQLSQQHRQPLTPRRPISVSLHGLSDAKYCQESMPMSAGGGGSGYFCEFPRVSRLRTLDLSQNDLGRAVLDLAEGLLWNTNLRSLILRENSLQPALFAPFIECLGINKGLVYLDISRNPVCGPSPVVVETLTQVLAQNRTLKGLFMSATGMTSEGAISLAECLPELHSLERLDVSENPGIDVAGLMALSASIKLNKSLICVEVTVNTGDEVCAALEQGIAQTCIANMQRLDTTAAQSSGSDFSLGLVSTHVWPHADMAPESNLPGVVSTKISGEDDRSEYTSLVTDISAVKRTYIDSATSALDGFFGQTADSSNYSDSVTTPKVVTTEESTSRNAIHLVIPAELETE
ncbi:hypothetical protein GGH94_000892 [Coemansia aciculifera]|uniref:RNI-like protein n=1 Tax=Coemansia aciculifera TaxID=417176 RepID=A0A9W8IVW0_9FUNG|nr:hypothetical protein GGH94_000892 [Coemansia aciculifera]